LSLAWQVFSPGKRGFLPRSYKREVRRAIGIFRVDGKMSLRSLKDCLRKILYVDVSLGFIYTELKRIASLARKINSKVKALVNIFHCTIDEVWIKVAKTAQNRNFGLVGVSPKSLFVSFFDYVERRDETTSRWFLKYGKLYLKRITGICPLKWFSFFVIFFNELHHCFDKVFTGAEDTTF